MCSVVHFNVFVFLPWVRPGWTIPRWQPERDGRSLLKVSGYRWQTAVFRSTGKHFRRWGTEGNETLIVRYFMRHIYLTHLIQQIYKEATDSFKKRTRYFVIYFRINAQLLQNCWYWAPDTTFEMVLSWLFSGTRRFRTFSVQKYSQSIDRKVNVAEDED